MDLFERIFLPYLPLFAVIPLVAFLATLVWRNRHEKAIALIVRTTKIAYILLSLAYVLAWIISGAKPAHYELITIYRSEDFVFAIQFYYDVVTAFFSVVGALLFFLVSTFSKYYMHRDEGYKRFFNTILFFALGYNLIIFSGNFETMFIGWEIIGLSSFLLIAFYRDRYLPVKNAFKVISNYRIGDVALMLAMWMMHHLTHRNIDFLHLAEARTTAVQTDHTGMATFIAAMILLAAMVKSAQLPFTTWLPRAMEGPTSSSAIFYGSLSVHIGVFLLLRTYPFWEDALWMKFSIVFIGALTWLIATLTSHVQPTVKTQIAYSSAGQIGLIFIEVALGFQILALVHFTGNAFLRTYQLLVSPSVLNYLVHHQYFHYHPPQEKPLSTFKATLYTLGIKEWNLDSLLFSYLWSPFKWAGRKMGWLHRPLYLIVLSMSGIAMFIYAVAFKSTTLPYGDLLPILVLVFALAMILYAFSHRASALDAWRYILLAHLYILSGVMLSNQEIRGIEVLFYASGIVVSFLLGYYCLKRAKSLDSDIFLNNYHGYFYEMKTTALFFLVAALGMLGFPVTAAFIGVDVIFTYVSSEQWLMISLLALSFLFVELASMRIFLRVFLGPHKKLDHPVAFRST